MKTEDLEKLKADILKLKDKEFNEVYLALTEEVKKRNKAHLSGNEAHKSTENV